MDLAIKERLMAATSFLSSHFATGLELSQMIVKISTHPASNSASESPPAAICDRSNGRSRLAL
jgi:hypothetical protein